MLVVSPSFMSVMMKSWLKGGSRAVELLVALWIIKSSFIPYFSFTSSLQHMNQITGYFNINMETDNYGSRNLNEILSSHSLSQLVSFPSHKFNHTFASFFIIQFYCICFCRFYKHRHWRYNSPRQRTSSYLCFNLNDIAYWIGDNFEYSYSKYAIYPIYSVYIILL